MLHFYELFNYLKTNKIGNQISFQYSVHKICMILLTTKKMSLIYS